jgi:putative FmdB family regulatory protein
MPLYLYDCLECKEQMNIRHSYKEINVRCILCGSQNIQKNLSTVLKVTKKEISGQEKAGTEVNKAIEEGKKTLEEYKKKQKKRIHKQK